MVARDPAPPDYAVLDGAPLSFDELGINLNVLPPDKPMAMYHEQPGQEDFLVLRGECLLIVEGEDRPVGQWDFVHCPPRTKHVIVGAGTEPALVLAAGARKGQATYPVDEVAVRHGAGVEFMNGLGSSPCWLPRRPDARAVPCPSAAVWRPVLVRGRFYEEFTGMRYKHARSA